MCIRDRSKPAAPNLARALATLACALPLLSPSLLAQTHKVAKTEDVVRAVGVYEWTGDMAKPAASRLIPVSLFINGKFEDAAVYLARPVPFALLTGNVYDLDKSEMCIRDRLWIIRLNIPGGAISPS